MMHSSLLRFGASGVFLDYCGNIRARSTCRPSSASIAEKVGSYVILLKSLSHDISSVCLYFSLSTMNHFGRHSQIHGWFLLGCY